MMVVSVGTFAHGFDELVRAADEAAADLELDGFAQIGGSKVVPTRLAWERFLPHAILQSRLRSALVIVCHGGAGIVGEAMRAGRPIVAMPRRGATSTAHPANDQLRFLERLAETAPITVCHEPAEMTDAVRTVLDRSSGPVAYPLGSNVPALIAAFLAGVEPPQSSTSQSGDRSG